MRSANDLTNELLTANAENLRQANKTIRQEMERGVFDIEAVKSANAILIARINESLEIADEGKKKRAAAEADLQKMEAELKDTPASAKARRQASAKPWASRGRVRRGGPPPLPAASLRAAALDGLAACGDAPVEVSAPVPDRPSTAPDTSPVPQPGAEAPPRRARRCRSFYARLETDCSRAASCAATGRAGRALNRHHARAQLRTIALFDEYVFDGPSIRAETSESFLRRWQEPVRFGVEFGARVPEPSARRTGPSAVSCAACPGSAPSHGL